MCGIIAYLGKRPAQEVLITGLNRLEYRGYDSAGLTIISKGKIKTLKSVGKVSNLRVKVDEQWPGPEEKESTAGIAHTRWATHGPPTEENAHPHLNGDGRISLVHNGIIENYQELKKKLESRDHTFSSETDSEVLCKLISEFYENDIEEAVVQALKLVEGTYGIALVCADELCRVSSKASGVRCLF